MKRWRPLVEVLGALAVVSSLIFVGMQMRQVQTIARSELGAGTFEYFATINQAVLDPDFSTVYEKMLKNPEQLSDEEMLRINAFLNLTTDFLARECYLKERGIFSECENVTRDIIKRYFGNPYARAWWKATDTRPEVGLPAWVDEAIENTPSNTQLKTLEDVKKLIETGI